MEKTYWNENGKYQEVFNTLWGKYVPSVGEVRLDNRKLESVIEAIRCANNVYYDVFNNGGCNIVDVDSDWGTDHYIREDYNKMFEKIDKFYGTGWLKDRLFQKAVSDWNDYDDDISNECEKMMNAVLEAAIKLELKPIEL